MAPEKGQDSGMGHKRPNTERVKRFRVSLDPDNPIEAAIINDLRVLEQRGRGSKAPRHLAQLAVLGKLVQQGKIGAGGAAIESAELEAIQRDYAEIDDAATTSGFTF